MKKCVDCGGSFNPRVKRNGRWTSSNRSRCYRCVPFGTSPYSRRYTPEERKIRDGGSSAKKMRRWRANRIAATGVDPILLFRQRRKEYVVNLLGGGCQLCGYNRCLRNLSFHHLSDKAFQLDHRAFQSSAKRLVPELKKCVLVCHNCHGEVHDGLVSEVDLRNINLKNMAALSGPLDFPSSKV